MTKLPLTQENVQAIRAASPCHGMLHLALIAALQPQRVLEIGSGFGRSTLFLALGLHGLGGRRVLDSVDIDQRVAQAAMERFDTTPVEVNLYERRSDEFFARCQEPYDYIFIDGDHGYAGFKADFEAAREHLSKRGIIVFDDALFHDMANVLRDLAVPCCLLDYETGFGLYTKTLELRNLYTAPLIRSQQDVNPTVAFEVAAFRRAYRVARALIPLSVFLSRTKRRLKKLLGVRARE
ncbi:MAG: class I SAM-dependent methyltransferase [Verrucomicrobiia bacterium]|jgi:SAM-dependent methyltransferase